MTTDVATTEGADGIYDWDITPEGDFETGDFFDSSLLYSILGERRASSSEVANAYRRRGWIGNENNDYENGSKIWLYEQSKLTRTIMGLVESESQVAVQWLLDDEFAKTISSRIIFVPNGLAIELTIRRSASEVDQRYFELWNNTGVSNA